MYHKGFFLFRILGVLLIAGLLMGAHGGSIQAESRPGQGTKFVIELPAAPAL